MPGQKSCRFKGLCTNGGDGSVGGMGISPPIPRAAGPAACCAFFSQHPVPGGYPRKLWMKLCAGWGMAAARQGCRGLPRFAQKTSNIKALCTKTGDEAVDSRRTYRCAPGGARPAAAWVFPDQPSGRRVAVDKTWLRGGNPTPGKRGKSCGQSADSLLQPTPGEGCSGSLRNRTARRGCAQSLGMALWKRSGITAPAPGRPGFARVGRFLGDLAAPAQAQPDIQAVDEQRRPDAHEGQQLARFQRLAEQQHRLQQHQGRREVLQEAQGGVG